MDRLRPEVILPLARPKRARVFGILGAMTFVFLGLPSMLAIQRGPCVGRRVRVDFNTEPSGARVTSQWGAPQCEAPCTIFVPRKLNIASFRISYPGHDDTFVHVRLDGGNTHVKAVLQPSK